LFVARPKLLPPTDAQAATPPPVQPSAPVLPERWAIQVDVYNGTTLGNAAAGYANRIAGLAYHTGNVDDAKRKNYEKTLVYYPPGAENIAKRLAGELDVGTAALPGGDNPRRLVVIVGKRTS
jgi:hypothetical protein